MSITRHRLKCFVASAFEREDVDEIFDSVVKPVLKAENMRAMRVDRVEHNDDIDDKILALIADCDFAIADLTYARPSVYFEAGRISGLGKPVVYMVRNDYLRQPAGDLKVHFDLQMKNIIGWSKPGLTLRNRLGSRIRHVTRPLFAEKDRQEVLKFQGVLFNALSWVDRAADIRNRTRKALRDAGYSMLRHQPGSDDAGYRVTERGTDVVALYIEQSFGKQDLRRLLGDMAFRTVRRDIAAAAGTDLPPARAFDALCMASRSVPASRVSNICPTFYHLEPGPFRDPSPPARVFRATSLHVLCPKSYEDLDRLLELHVPELGRRGI